MKQYMELMGLPGKDKVTGFTGVVECVSFDLYGCVQVALKPQEPDKDGKIREGHWFDHKRITVLSETPVMPVPNYDLAMPKAVAAPKERGAEQGPADKPAGRNP